jgi:hypothetical protein
MDGKYFKAYVADKLHFNDNKATVNEELTDEEFEQLLSMDYDEWMDAYGKFIKLRPKMEATYKELSELGDKFQHERLTDLLCTFDRLMRIQNIATTNGQKRQWVKAVYHKLRLHKENIHNYLLRFLCPDRIKHVLYAVENIIDKFMESD